MARPRRQSSGSSLSPGQAQYVVEQMLKERRISAGEIARYVGDMDREIGELEARLMRLREAAGPAAAAAAAGLAAGAAGAVVAIRRRRGRPPGRPRAAAPAAPAPAKATRKRRRAITAEQLASRQLQGKYLALVRRFPASKRAQFAKIAKERGREAAIKEMQDAKK